PAPLSAADAAAPTETCPPSLPDALPIYAPHIVWPMRFVLPLAEGIRPPWLVRLGLFLYDHIGGRKLLPATRTLDMRRDPSGKPLDRKSTRLNSSHVKISYAVFCLKKKHE